VKNVTKTELLSEKNIVVMLVLFKNIIWNNFTTIMAIVVSEVVLPISGLALFQ
jgi:hypothetical protein